MTRSALVAGSRAIAIMLLTSWAAIAGLGADHRVLGATLAAATASALWVHSRLPLVTLGAAFLGLVAVTGLAGFEGPDDPFLVIILWSTFAVGRYAPLRSQPWAAAATLFFLSLNLLDGAQLSVPAEVVFPLLLTAAPWLLGLAVHLAHDRADRADAVAGEVGLRAAALERASETERLRVARELHDVAAHHLSAVSLQAQVLRRRVDAGDSATAEDLGCIEMSARAAMDELRRIASVIRSTGDPTERAPQPGIGDLPQLVAECARAGQSVDLLTTGTPRTTSAGLSLSAYRIVQEALSNARRHGAGPTACAEIEWGASELHLRVTNPVASGGNRWMAGHGLIGMRERVGLYGGVISVGPDRCGAWVIDVVLPVTAT